jgi:hypothetical protein
MEVKSSFKPRNAVATHGSEGELSAGRPKVTGGFGGFHRSSWKVAQQSALGNQRVCCHPHQGCKNDR